MFLYYLLQFVIFILKNLNRLLESTIGFSLFSGRSKDRERSLNDFDFCAHRLKVVARAKRIEIGPADLSSFLLLHSSYEDPRISILKSADVILINVDKNGATFGVFPGLGPVDIFDSKHGPFFYNVQYKKCTELIIVPIYFFVRLADSAKPLGPKIVLLSSTGRCGSTLLTQMFEAIPGTITISEPSFMSGLFSSDWKSNFGKNVLHSRPQLLAAGFKLQCKTLNRPEVETVVIKTASMMVSLTGDVVRGLPEVRHIFMFRNLDKNINSFMALMQGTPRLFRPILRPKFLRFLRDLIPSENADLRERMEKVNNDLTTFDDDVCGHRWMTVFVGSHILCFLNARDKDGVNFCQIKYEDLLSNPSQEFLRISDHCQIKEVPIEKCLKALEKDSQKGTSLSRESLNKFKKMSFDEKETNEINDILIKLGIPTMADFTL